MRTHARGVMAALFGAALAAAAAGPVFAEEALTGAAILESVDETMSAPRDQVVESTLVLIDRDGGRKERTLQMLQKGASTRMVRFLAPADQKGISVLSLPDGSIYLYLPAFKKVKRIASHVKNTEFAGTDFTYDDMEAKRYSEFYTAELVRAEADSYVIALAPRQAGASEYSKLIMWVRKDSFVPIVVEFYDAKGVLSRRMRSERVEKVGRYWVAREREMENIARGHKSTMIVTSLKFDSGLSDDMFTTRALER
ncbi:MAG: outer membrane lipoprotein-sorting protein [Spirochaetes bacterium]|nr:outer membrane lipoprotein-sorting protein [Spirochaetota bacterium]